MIIKSSPLRLWIGITIVSFFLVLAYFYILPNPLQLAEKNGLSHDACETIVFFLGFPPFLLSALGILMVGLLVAESKQGRLLAVAGGWMLVIRSIVQTIELIFGLLDRYMSMHINCVSVRIIYVVLLAILMCSSLLVIAIHYKKNDMLAMAITYTITDVIIKARTIWAMLTQNDARAVSAIGILLGNILLIIYFCKWWKIEKHAEMVIEQ